MDERWLPALGAPAARGVLRASPIDFQVIEELPFELSGEGEHDWLFVEKTGLTTWQAAERLARAAGVHPKHVGFSGMKDRRAVTRQWFSMPAQRLQDVLVDSPELRVVSRSRHRRKLKRGAHRGNRFRIVVRRFSDPAGDVEQRLLELRRHGMPNYFGEQRFGRGGRNTELAKNLFAGARLGRLQKSMALSAARALIFNDLLSLRVADGCWNRLVDGDVAGLDGSGSVFSVDGDGAELEQRVDSLDVHPTGPLWGSGSRMVGGVAADYEQRAAEGHPELAAGLARTMPARRRALRARIALFEWAVEGDSLELSFALGRGQFATALLREVVDVD